MAMDVVMIAAIGATIFFVLLGGLILFTDREMVIGILCILIGFCIAFFAANLAIGGWIIVAIIGAIIAYVVLDYLGII